MFDDTPLEHEWEFVDKELSDDTAYIRFRCKECGESFIKKEVISMDEKTGTLESYMMKKRKPDLIGELSIPAWKNEDGSISAKIFGVYVRLFPNDRK